MFTSMNNSTNHLVSYIRMIFFLCFSDGHLAQAIIRNTEKDVT